MRSTENGGLTFPLSHPLAMNQSITVLTQETNLLTFIAGEVLS
jgi:hypothetical protein